ncbi:hypothetical protein J6590_082331 [Homalodisca vitripennis]|nr:hypothetical protein J6590_082331 [Homalodisca vitripennis]
MQQADALFLWGVLRGTVDCSDLLCRIDLRASRLTRSCNLFFGRSHPTNYIMHGPLPRLHRLGNQLCRQFDFFDDSQSAITGIFQNGMSTKTAFQSSTVFLPPDDSEDSSQVTWMKIQITRQERDKSGNAISSDSSESENEQVRTSEGRQSSEQKFQYGSMYLETLANMSIVALGSVRINRFPGLEFSSDRDEEKNGGSEEEKVTDIDGIPIIALKWFDNKDVIMATTFNSCESQSTMERFDNKVKAQCLINSVMQIARLLWAPGFLRCISSDSVLSIHIVQVAATVNKALLTPLEKTHTSTNTN